MVRFSRPRRSNPFDNPLVAVLLHALVMVAVIVSIGVLLVEGTFVPLVIVAVLTLVIEAAWLYFRLRK